MTRITGGLRLAPMETKGSDSGVSRLRSLDRFQWKHRGVPLAKAWPFFTLLHNCPHPTVSIGDGFPV